MKPFNLEAALAGEPVVTRDGRDVANVTYFENATSVNKVAALLDGYVVIFTENGKIIDGEEFPSDLFMKPKKRLMWLNLYQYHEARWYDTKEKADKWYDIREKADKGMGPPRIGGCAWPIEVVD